jgi:hypothetical protein
MNASAGPAPGSGFGHLPSGVQRALGLGGRHGGGMGHGWGGTSTTLTSAEHDIYRYVSAHRDGAEYLMATGSWSQAAPFIMATGAEVLPMGGFSGSVPAPTLARVRQLASAGQLRYFLLSPQGAGLLGMFGRSSGGEVLAITNWVRDSCDEVLVSQTSGPLYRCGS